MTSTFLDKGHLLRELTDPPHMEGLMVCDRCGGGESELETPCAERLAERLSQNSWKLEAYANIQNWVEGLGFSAFVEVPAAFSDLLKQRDELKRRLGEGPARVQELQRKLDDALAANKEMGDAIEQLAKELGLTGTATQIIQQAIFLAK